MKVQLELQIDFAKALKKGTHEEGDNYTGSNP